MDHQNNQLNDYIKMMNRSINNLSNDNMSVRDNWYSIVCLWTIIYTYIHVHIHTHSTLLTPANYVYITGSGADAAVPVVSMKKAMMCARRARRYVCMYVCICVYVCMYHLCIYVACMYAVTLLYTDILIYVYADTRRWRAVAMLWSVWWV